MTQLTKYLKKFIHVKKAKFHLMKFPSKTVEPQILDVSGDVIFCTGIKMFFGSRAWWFESLIFFPLNENEEPFYV
jgi:hypothetical protein